jgi:hypothetical protein
MKKIILTLVLVLSIITLADAQDYKTGIGLRGGISQGLTLKHFVSEKAAFEGIIATRMEEHGFELTGLYEIHNMAFEVEHLNWYYGGGATLGFYNGNNVSWGTSGNTSTVLGIDGILGIEYSFSEAPINIGLDLKPTLNLIGYYGFWVDSALSIRYIF